MDLLVRYDTVLYDKARSTRPGTPLLRVPCRWRYVELSIGDVAKFPGFNGGVTLHSLLHDTPYYGKCRVMNYTDIDIEYFWSDEVDRERFYGLIEERGREECWPWKGPVTKGRYGAVYGVFRYRGNYYKPHRIAYVTGTGQEIPEGWTIDHVAARGCRSKLCCNPAHLEAVTQAENVRRYWATRDRTRCKRGHRKQPGMACPACAVVAVARSQAKRPEYYREMKRLQKQKERAKEKAS